MSFPNARETTKTKYSVSGKFLLSRRAGPQGRTVLLPASNYTRPPFPVIVGVWGPSVRRSDRDLSGTSRLVLSERGDL